MKKFSKKGGTAVVVDVEVTKMLAATEVPFDLVAVEEWGGRDVSIQEVL